MSNSTSGEWIIREAKQADIDQLLEIENACFTNDKLSRRSFRRHIQSELADIFVAEMSSNELLAYGLVLKQRGTRLARLYSLAVLPSARGLGLAKALMLALENAASTDERHYMRLEVAKNNHHAIKIYEAAGYSIFGEYLDYYEDHSDALRMQKRIRTMPANAEQRITPWVRQRTEFTCGPAALLMAMASLAQEFDVSLSHEIDIWREATTVYMTSGLGGCHPMGLALAVSRRGFHSEVWLNSDQPLFLDGVRSEHKKEIMTTVHNHFVSQCQAQQLPVHYQPVTVADIEQYLRKDCAVIILVSTYRLDGKKSPHWVVVTGADESCLFVHDPHVDEKEQQAAIDCQAIPIAKEDFDKMSAFGVQRLRAAIVVSAK